MTERVRQGGFTLLEFLVAVGLTGLLIVGAAAYLKSTIRARLMTELRDEAVSARMHIIRSFSCSQTVPSPAVIPDECTSATDPFFEVLTNDPAAPALIQDPNDRVDPADLSSAKIGYTRFGQYTYLRARCEDCPECVGGKKIQFEYAQGTNLPSSDPNVVPDPTPIDRTGPLWQDLFRGIPAACQIAP